MKKSKINLKENGYEIYDLVKSGATCDGCYFYKIKSNKKINDTIRSYGFTTEDIKKFISESNFEAKEQAKLNANANNRRNHSWPYRMGKQYDYSAFCDGTSLLEIDEKELEKILQKLIK